jgi:hypothetical protein
VARTNIEFYKSYGDQGGLAALNNVNAVPDKGEMINIRGVTYKVVKRAWAVDHADNPLEQALRANIDLEKV